MKKFYRPLLRALLPALLGLLPVTLLQADSHNPDTPIPGTVIHLRIDAAIGPATADYILDGLRVAADTNARALVLELDTPGGLDSAMRDIIKGILASDVPVITWVAPAGSRAASAGTYMLYASHVAAMNPTSNLGAATPVTIGGAPTPPNPLDAKPAEAPADASDDIADTDTDAAGDEQTAPPATPDMPADAGKAKMVNDAVAYIRGLAELRGRNADWAERAVREAVSLGAREALEENVIDLVAATMDDLLTQADGREVEANGTLITLATEGAAVEYLEPNWRTALLTIITDPSVAYLLMLAGIYGLLLEGYNPGALVPGVVGGICLLLALFAFQVLPVNYAGLALMLLGVALMIAEGFAPSFGVLGIGGLAAFVFGSIILMDTDVPGFAVSPSIIGGIAAAGGLSMLGLMYMVLRARNRPVVSGVEKIIGDHAEVLESFNGRGSVFLEGERWLAESSVELEKGQTVIVTAINGLVLQVAPAKNTGE